MIDQEENIYIEFERIECPIRQLKEKINEYIMKLTSFASDKDFFDEFIVSNIDIILPYNWSYATIHKPKGMILKKHMIDLDEKEYKTQIKIRADYIKNIKNNISLKFNNLSAISEIVNKIL